MLTTLLPILNRHLRTFDCEWKIMKKRSWLTGLFLIILSSIAIIVRIYYVNRLMSEVNISEDIYNAAKVTVEMNSLTSAFADGFQMRSLYICNLYLAFLIFGNFTVAGVYLNILYQILTVLLVYIVIKGVTNRYAGFAGGLILALFPAYINTLSDVTMQNMIICIAVFFGVVVISIIRRICQRHIAKKNSSDKLAADKTNLKENNEAVKADTNAIPDTSMKEIRYDDLEDNKVQYIENPLPVPKRREHKEMNYAFEPTGSNDDYDLKDLSGKDFYDIE